MDILEKDWKMYRKMMPTWQERYMEKLSREYIELLSKDDAGSSKFWQLYERIKKDSKSIGVVVEYRRSQMKWQLIDLVDENVISKEELNCFSQELRDELEPILNHRTIYSND